MDNRVGTGRVMTRPGTGEIDLDLVLNVLPSVVFVVNARHEILYANSSAENFFQSSASTLRRQRLDHLLPADNPLFSLIRQASSDDHSVSEYHVTLASPRIGRHTMNIQAAPLGEPVGGRRRHDAGTDARRQDRPAVDAARRRPLGQRDGGDAGARGEEPAVRHPRRGAAARGERPRRGPRSSPA